MLLYKYIVDVAYIYCKNYLIENKRASWNMPAPGYSSVSLPDGLVEQVDKTIEKLRKNDIDLGFNSKAEFIKAAIRAYIKEVTTIYLLGVREE